MPYRRAGRIRGRRRPEQLDDTTDPYLAYLKWIKAGKPGVTPETGHGNTPPATVTALPETQGFVGQVSWWTARTLELRTILTPKRRKRDDSGDRGEKNPAP
ncbi:hypothetical protein JOE66_000197 [Subtercola frigoramans]|uniref:Uncharacterized protein n=1 Tax=Subtercola frigoramans TaxID=120298 RepID=A0ABS2L0G1_9MICO|nr:hypothetical protein [Subtercola frigoramans]